MGETYAHMQAVHGGYFEHNPEENEGEVLQEDGGEDAVANPQVGPAAVQDQQAAIHDRLEVVVDDREAGLERRAQLAERVADMEQLVQALVEQTDQVPR